MVINYFQIMFETIITHIVGYSIVISLFGYYAWGIYKTLMGSEYFNPDSHRDHPPY